MLKFIMALAATGAGLGVMLLAGMLFLQHALEERGMKKLDGYEGACLGWRGLRLRAVLLGAAAGGQRVCELADSRTEQACGR